MAEKLQDKLNGQRSSRTRSLKIVTVVLLLLLLGVGAVSYYWLGAPLSPYRTGKKNQTSGNAWIEPPNKLNIVIMGIDSRPQDGDPGRSDTLLVATIDTGTRDVSVISIPRDTRVKIDGVGWDKIYHAFSYGGAALSLHTAEQFLGIPLDYFVTVDMDGFIRAVDALGGVTLDVEKRMQYEDTWDHFVIDLKPGLQRMDGKTALQYVRYRDEEGDIGRVARQQKFMRAVLAEASSPLSLLKAPVIIREVFASINTDIPLPLMVGLAGKLKDGMAAGLKTYMVEGLPYYIDGISYWIPDVMKSRQKVAELQNVAFSGDIRAAAQRLAEEYRRNLPARARLDDGSPDTPATPAAKSQPDSEKATGEKPAAGAVVPHPAAPAKSDAAPKQKQ